MFIFLLQLRHMLEGHPELYLFAVYSALIWGLWLLKVLLSSRYRPFTGEFSGSTSVVVPVVDEPLDLFRDVIGRMVEQRPDEIIVVINGAPNPGLVAVCEEYAPLVRWVHTPIPGKRNAVKIGTELSRGEITVLVDSDTVWTEGTLPELVRPFADPSIGGVTTRQRILEPERSWITRWADWLENTRSLYSMPAQSVLGQVGCLPGRTIAFRRSILMRVMHDFMTARFLGVFLEVSDDRTLTNLTLKAGYRTVYQHTSLVYTDAPLQVRKLFKQQLRWARGSQYNTLRMLPWMLGHAPVLAVFFIMDIVLPFLLYGVILGWLYRTVTGQGINLYEGILREYGVGSGIVWVLGLMVVSSVLSMAIRQLRHLAEKPSDFFRLPVFIIVSTLFLMPVRLIGFFRLAHASGWGTRAGAYAGGSQDAELEAAAAQGAQVIMTQGGRVALPTDAAGIPVSPVDAPGIDRSPRGDLEHGGVLTGLAPTRVEAPTARRAPAAPVGRRTRRRRLNPLAAIPYLIGIGIFALEAIVIV
ncbi:glycosyltransferase family 2 protein [Homoserinibacter sp. YIM 151385]|uniref:glycosyltransferase family 2 protein n=1 Tax=Homoserinibacter sp. YIM 151385 TaxID=2985506 RepID=UPI0022F1078C|nr:glycosyltransferase family 2 protein [Homoserinibacter sp. YIM 151385]WBU38475.1 glycosyltransferase family 2 protein [Homoserinibacter sp. YIM 151385]